MVGQRYQSRQPAFAPVDDVENQYQQGDSQEVELALLRPRRSG